MGQISLQNPVVGQLDSTEDPKITSDFITLQTLVNGNLDPSNISQALGMAAGVNVAGQTVSGASFNSGLGSRASTTYGPLGDAADQVTGITLPVNGLIAVWFKASWQELAAGASRAAIFLGSNQLKVASAMNAGGVATTAPVTQAAATAGDNPHSSATPLLSSPFGLISLSGGPFASDVSTGQAVAVYTQGSFTWESDGFIVTSYNLGSSSQGEMPVGGPCYIFAAPGVYTVSVQYKASSSTVSASNRRLWVRAISF